jgi:hypothetical protein
MDQPQEVMAQDFMGRKGYPDLMPVKVTKLEGQDCWYFYYRLSQGTLELEVFYDPDTKDWQTAVTAFPAVRLKTEGDRSNAGY